MNRSSSGNRLSNRPLKAAAAWLLLSALLLSCLDPAQGQESGLAARIDDYCRNIDRMECDVVSMSGESVNLDYFICDGKPARITEQDFGYRYVQSTVQYYLREGEPVRVDADIERINDDGSSLTLELHRIWFSGETPVLYRVSERSYNPDSLYSVNPDPVKTAAAIRTEAKYKDQVPDPVAVKRILNNLDIFLKQEPGNDEPLPGGILSPFL